MMSLAVILAVLAVTGYVNVPMLIVLALLLGCANAVDMPVRQSFAVEMVGREDIGNAVALNSAMFNGARIVGPAIAGLTIGAVGVAAAFVIDAVSFLAVIVGLAGDARERAARSRRGSPGPTSVARRDRRTCARVSHYVRTTPVVLLAVLVVGLVATVGMNFSVVIPALAQDVLHSGATGYGFLMAASGVGSLLAALWLAFGGGPAVRRASRCGAIVLGRRRGRARRLARLRGLDGADGRRSASGRS